MRKSLCKSPIVATQPKETSQLCKISGWRPIQNCLEFLYINLYSFRTYNMSQIQDLCQTKLTFRQLSIEGLLLQDSQNSVYVLQMLLSCFIVNQDIIKNYQNNFSKILVEYLIHTRLECCWCISKAKWHNKKFKVPIVTSESGLFHIFPHADLMVP